MEQSPESGIQNARVSNNTLSSPVMRTQQIALGCPSGFMCTSESLRSDVKLRHFKHISHQKEYVGLNTQ